MNGNMTPIGIERELVYMILFIADLQKKGCKQPI